jgi:hypothetical protein
MLLVGALMLDTVSYKFEKKASEAEVYSPCD